MADGIAITAGTGTTILTDDTGAGGHAQVVKLAISTDGSGTLIPADANGLEVQGAVAHDGASAGNPLLQGGIASAAAPADVSADGDAVRAWHLRNGAAAVAVTAAGALVGGDATNGLDVDVTRVSGTVAIGDGTNAVSVSTAAADDVANTANRMRTASAPHVFNGTTWDRMRGDVTNGLDVDVTRVQGTVAVGDGTNAVSVSTAAADAVANTSNRIRTAAALHVFNGTTWDRVRGDITNGIDVDVTRVGGVVDVEGNVAHDGVDSGFPLKVGMRALAHGTNPTAVAAADRTDWLANRAGIPWVIGGHPNVVTVKHTTITTAVTDAAIITVAGGLKIVVTRITVTLDNASTVFPSVLIGFGATNTPTTTGVLASHGGVPAGGGMNVGDGSGILGIGGDGEDLRVTTVGNATGNGLQICVSYYTIES
jgi:hypothetical protein